MTPEGPRRRKFAELMAHHIFTDVHRDEFVTVVHSERKANKVGGNGGPPRPGPYDVLVTCPIDLFDLRSQFLIYDALNTILTATGDSLSFWEVNLLDPDEGFVVPLLPPQPEGLQLGNPSFARTTGRQVAFDRLDSRIGSNEIWVFDLVTGDAGFIVDTGAALGFPSFAVDDSELAYNRQDGSGRRIVAQIPLDESRLASAATSREFSGVIIGTASTPLVIG